MTMTMVIEATMMLLMPSHRNELHQLRQKRPAEDLIVVPISLDELVGSFSVLA
jgi:hypothetical protein